MRQMMRADEDVTRRERHVLRQLALRREVALVRVGVFEILLHVQRERQHWSKTGERLIVEALTAELILRAGRNTRRHYARRTQRIAAAWRTNGSLKYLHGIQQGGWRWTAGRQDTLLLLDRIRDVRVERDREQRMIVEDSERRADNGFVFIPRIPRNGKTRRPVVLVARESLLHAHRVLCGEDVSRRQVDARQRIAQRQRRHLYVDFVVVTHAVVQRDVWPHLPRILR